MRRLFVRRVDSLLSRSSEHSEVARVNRREEGERSPPLSRAVLGAALDVARRPAAPSILRGAIGMA
jgi:hypothetical protein